MRSSTGSSVDKVFLDVNIPMYAGGKDHRYKESCAWIMTRVAEGRLSVATDTEAIQEILYRYGAIERWETGVAMANALMQLVPEIYPIDLEDIRCAVGLFQTYGPKRITARDVLHAAVMMNRGLKEILSTDSHFDLIEGITRVDPEHLFLRRKSNK